MQNTSNLFILFLTFQFLRLFLASPGLYALINPALPPEPNSDDHADGLRSPLESHSSYRGDDWSPQRLMFHQNLESFADRVGLIVALQSNGKLSQEAAYSQIRKIWKELKTSKDQLINPDSKGNTSNG